MGISGPWQSVRQGAFSGDNLLLITIDTLRADRLGSYGSPARLTPNMDRLAAEGIRFDNVLAHVPLTLPSHTSMFTSKYPTEHGVHDNGTFRVKASLPTLATVLKRAGYHSGAFVGAFVLDARFGLNRGFDVYDDYYGEKRAFLSFVQLERRADAVVAPAERWIQEGARAPWFAWVHLFDPHAPYEAPPDFQSKFPADPYGAEVAYVDEVVGSFLEGLKATGSLSHTLVMILGDHGE
ncbi:MAG: sulfatase [Acidobacteriota bacterium]